MSIGKGYQIPFTGTKHNKNVRATISASAPGNVKVAGEGSYPGTRNNSRGVSERQFSSAKEGWEKLSGNQSEKTQSIHLLLALQNERFALREISFGTKRFPVQDRSQRRLLSNCSQQTVIKICLCFMPLPLFWFRDSSKRFYQITKNPHSSFETNKHSNNYLSGRYVTDGVDLSGNYDSEGYIDFSVAKFGVFYKSEKVNPTTSETTGISEATYKYRGSDTVSLRRKTDSYN